MARRSSPSLLARLSGAVDQQRVGLAGADRGADAVANNNSEARSCSGYPPLDPVREWRRESEVNDANQDLAGDGEEDHRQQRRGERVAAAAATVRSAGCGGRPRTAAPGRGGE